jgi:hypothetical protein
MVVDVINLHLKSRRPTNIQGHRINERTWKTASGWAEGVFISSMKRIGQSLETRILIDRLFDEDPSALIAVCGDFNEEFDEVALEGHPGRRGEHGKHGSGHEGHGAHREKHP